MDVAELFLGVHKRWEKTMESGIVEPLYPAVEVG